MPRPQYQVVVNHEEQYSIWPVERALPRGWSTVGRSGSQDECKTYIQSLTKDVPRLPKDVAAGDP